MASRRRSSRTSVTGTITDLQRRVKYLQNRQTPTQLANEVVARSAIQPRAVASDQIALDAVANDQIAANAVKGENIEPNEIGSREIATGGVENQNIRNEAVTNEKISAGPPYAIDNQRLSDAAVERRNMTPNSVENSSLRTDSVSFRTVAPNAIGNENLLGDSVGNDEVQGNAISQNNMQNDSVGFGEMQSSSVGNSTLQNGAVTDGKIGGTVSGGKIGSGINGGNISAGSIKGRQIAARTIGSNNIKSGSFPVIVSQGLNAGYGINKRGSTISIDTGDIATNAHRHSYSYGIFTEQFDGISLKGFDVRSGSTQGPFYSSKKFKTNISEHETEDPKKLLELKLKKFKYKKSKSLDQQNSRREWMHGYILEELVGLGFDEVVHYDEEGNPERLDYGLFSTLVLELVKVQQQEIESLQDRVKRLEEK